MATRKTAPSLCTECAGRGFQVAERDTPRRVWRSPSQFELSTSKKAAGSHKEIVKRVCPGCGGSGII